MRAERGRYDPYVTCLTNTSTGSDTRCVWIARQIDIFHWNQYDKRMKTARGSANTNIVSVSRSLFLWFLHHTSCRELRWGAPLSQSLCVRVWSNTLTYMCVCVCASFRRSSATRPPSCGPRRPLKCRRQGVHLGWRTGRCLCWFRRRSSRWRSAPPSRSGQWSSRGGQKAAHSWEGEVSEIHSLK